MDEEELQHRMMYDEEFQKNQRYQSEVKSLEKVHEEKLFELYMEND